MILDILSHRLFIRRLRMNMPELHPEDFSMQLLRWYDTHRRSLPWREDPTPYHVWISEIMLQQTRVEAVKDYYRRFLHALPDIAALAEAPEDLYMKCWEGLGYYSRVRNLHKGAIQILEEYHGVMPDNSQELLKIAGIGPYTAAAIASIAFGERIPAVDGNLLRIFARLTEYNGNIKTDAAKKSASAWFLEHMPSLGTGDFNQALMDLGAMICIPNGTPLCGQCPLNICCHAFGHETIQTYPMTAPKKQRTVEGRTVFLIHDDMKIAIRKRPARGLLAGLYEFPNTEGHLLEKEALRYVQSLGFSPLRIKRLPEAKHIFTHKEWHMIGYEILADELAPVPPSSYMAENVLNTPLTDAIRQEPLQVPDAAASPDECGKILLVSLKSLKEQYSLPSAFRVYRSLLQ